MNSQETIVLAGGCFWCVESIFKKLRGVTRVLSGYANSTVPSPTYELVCRGSTGAAEAVKIEFVPQIISLETLLDIFWATHDPTSLNRQGADTGSMYRSAIFYTSPKQEKTARSSKAKIPGAVTEISPLENFTPAETYHQDFYNNHQGSLYCRFVIDPKLKKLTEAFKDQLL